MRNPGVPSLASRSEKLPNPVGLCGVRRGRLLQGVALKLRNNHAVGVRTSQKTWSPLICVLFLYNIKCDLTVSPKHLVYQASHLQRLGALFNSFRQNNNAVNSSSPIGSSSEQSDYRWLEGCCYCVRHRWRTRSVYSRVCHLEATYATGYQSWYKSWKWSQ